MKKVVILSAVLSTLIFNSYSGAINENKEPLVQDKSKTEVSQQSPTLKNLEIMDESMLLNSIVKSEDDAMDIQSNNLETDEPVSFPGKIKGKILKKLPFFKFNDMQ